MSFLTSAWDFPQKLQRVMFVGRAIALTLSCPPGWSPAPRGDRKSTRLNSSHSQISYAVFCLKKKKDAVFSIYAVQPCVPITSAVGSRLVTLSFPLTMIFGPEFSICKHTYRLSTCHPRSEPRP